MSLLFKKNKRSFNRDDDPIRLTNNNYRRNSTIVHRHGLVDDSRLKRLQTHKLTNRWRKTFFVLIIIIAMMVLMLVVITNFTARPLAIFSNDLKHKPESKDYELVIQNYLDDNPLSRLNFIIKMGSLKAYLSRLCPEVETVKLISMGSLGQTKFLIEMRQPIISWSINNNKYYVDEQGITFDINYYQEPDLSIIDDAGAPVETGSTMVSQRLLGFVGQSVSRASKSGYRVTEAILPEGTMRQVDFKLADIKPYVKLSIDRPIGEQIEDMDRALRYFKDHNVQPNYVDVRVSNKAFYD